MKHITTVGLDLAKHVFQVHGADAEGSTIFNRKLRRAEVMRFFEKQPACLVGLEACGSSHYWAREIAALGHEVRLIPPAYVKPFVKRGKERLGGISKMGNPELRSLLVLGATGVLRCARGNPKAPVWLTALLARRPYKVAAVALANKMARIIWALLTKGGTYRGLGAAVTPTGA